MTKPTNLIDLIKTKNGLNFLGNNLTELKNSVRYGHALNTRYNYDDEVVYPETDFSYKKFARTMGKKYHGVFANLVYELRNNVIGDNKTMLTTLNSAVLEFDGDYIKLEGKDITYMPYNKMQEFDNYEYLQKGRQSISLHKFLSKVFKGKHQEASIKALAELIIAETHMELEVVFIKGEAIGESYYNVSHKGWSRYSCMANVAGYPPKKFTIYNENCELGLIMNGEENVGRFLRWTTVDGKHIEDSLYYKTYAVQEWYKNRVKTEKIISKTIHTDEILDAVVELVRPYSTYKVDEKPPYQDSFSYPSKDGMRLYYDYDKVK